MRHIRHVLVTLSDTHLHWIWPDFFCQGQRSCCVHWTSGLQLEILTKLPQKNISKTSLPLYANIAWRRLRISQMLRSSFFQWSVGFLSLSDWSEKHAKDKARILWLVLTSHSSLHKLVFSAMYDPSYCSSLLPSCLAGHNLLLSQFLSAIEGI